MLPALVPGQQQALPWSARATGTRGQGSPRLSTSSGIPGPAGALDSTPYREAGLEECRQVPQDGIQRF